MNFAITKSTLQICNQTKNPRQPGEQRPTQAPNMAIDQQILIASSRIRISTDMPVTCVALYNKLVRIVFLCEDSTVQERKFCADALLNEVTLAKVSNLDLFTNEDIVFLAETRLNIRDLVELETNTDVAGLLLETDMMIERVFEDVKHRCQELVVEDEEQD